MSGKVNDPGTKDTKDTKDTKGAFLSFVFIVDRGVTIGSGKMADCASRRGAQWERRSAWAG